MGIQQSGSLHLEKITSWHWLLVQGYSPSCRGRNLGHSFMKIAEILWVTSSLAGTHRVVKSWIKSSFHQWDDPMSCIDCCNCSDLIFQPEDRKSSWIPDIYVSEWFHFGYKYAHASKAKGCKFVRNCNRGTITASWYINKGVTISNTSLLYISWAFSIISVWRPRPSFLQSCW